MGRAAGGGRPAHRQLTIDEELELLIGPGRIPGETDPSSNFESDEDRHQAWLAHEDEIREACGGEPWAAKH
jgi:hypothetical protein